MEQENGPTVIGCDSCDMRINLDENQDGETMKSYLIKDTTKEEPGCGLENQKIFKTPIVRNGKQATVGYQPDVWKGWK